MTTLREFLATSASSTRVAEVKISKQSDLIHKPPNYTVAVLALHAEQGNLNRDAAKIFIRALLQTADKAECTDYLHRVFLPLAERRGGNALWTNLTLLAVYLGETAIAQRAAKDSGSTWLQHYLTWSLGDFQPDSTDHPLAGRSPLNSPPDSPPDSPLGNPQPGVTIGILDYKLPQRHKLPDSEQTNNNISDVIHSVAFMRHLARFYAPHWSTGDPRLATALQFLQYSWPEDQRQPRAQPVTLRILDRDSAWAGTNPAETTYLPLYGWFDKLPFDAPNAPPVFPLPPHIQPLFLGLHLHESHLTPSTIAWLKTCEPIGCRDKTTSDYLASAGVQTFFAGCLTTTLQLAAGSVGPVLTPRAAHYRVDLPPPPPPCGRPDRNRIHRPIPSSLARRPLTTPTLRRQRTGDHRSAAGLPTSQVSQHLTTALLPSVSRAGH